MPDHDIAVDGLPRVAIAAGTEVTIESAGPYIRICGSDLREVAQRASASREDHPGVDVLVDIDVVVAATAAAARDLVDTVDAVWRAGTLRYIGTPAGLAGLINDVHALGITDGAILRPLSPAVADLIGQATIPLLQTLGANGFDLREARPA